MSNLHTGSRTEGVDVRCWAEMRRRIVGSWRVVAVVWAVVWAQGIERKGSDKLGRMG